MVDGSRTTPDENTILQEQVRQQNEPLEEDGGPILDAVIVGAGWAGLGAANQLLLSSYNHRSSKKASTENSTNFSVLEARSYVGGRSVTSLALGDDHPVDLGSSWVHGNSKKNPIQKLLNQSGLPFATTDPHSVISYDDTNQRISRAELARWEKFAEDFEAYMARRQDNDPHDTSLQQVLRDFMRKRNINPNSRLGCGLHHVLEADIAYEYAAPLHELSLHWWDEDGEFSGHDSYLATAKGGGYSSLIAQYAKPVADRIQLRTRVTHIEYEHNKLVTIRSIHSETGEAQKPIRARHVIVTLPLGVLQSGSVHFQPPLPKTKQKAICGLGMATLNKFVLHWDNMDESKIFWNRKKEWINKMDPSGEADGDLQFCEFYNPCALDRGHSDNKKVSLVGFAYGDDAIRMETMSNEEVTQWALASLRALYDTKTVPEPTQSLVTRWQSDPYACGSYSYQRACTSRGNQSRRDLEKPVHNQLFFAGEAVSLLYPGTTHGALLSGISSGRKVTDRLQTMKNGKR